MPGKLVIVGTPIGNLSDLSPRAIEALKAADLILCEDTRHTRKLLTHFGIDRPTQSFHEHNEEEKGEKIIEKIVGGAVIALVSDAGMPVISDPGFRLVRLARERDVAVEPIPGPFAGIMALVASGIAPAPFSFFGFAPHREGERVEFYGRVASVAQTTIVYESPERLIDSLKNAMNVLGDVEVTVAREMTKIHEEFISGSISEVIARLEAQGTVRGEVTLVFAAAHPLQRQVSREELLREFGRLRDSGMRRSDAVKMVADKFGLRKNEVYKSLLDER
ncbi:MAG TPA: 16S rRNA (cytidine(1402)-2'-O)-methyltransferase [Thermoanaerobaculia bacterium]|nr:16S rRNA (cytidine(1402)-2'-O)-methyltransferase [Thermoanaerobaculia bacterium]